jgi:lactoylglutathione lyase
MTADQPARVELKLNGFGLGLGTVQAAKTVHGVDASPGSPAMVLVVWTTTWTRPSSN